MYSVHTEACGALPEYACAGTELKGGLRSEVEAVVAAPVLAAVAAEVPVYGLLLGLVDPLTWVRWRARTALRDARPGGPQVIGWPPGRNQPCWCRSGRKYKKCCAAPALATLTYTVG